MSYRIIGIANNVSRNDSAPLWINDCCVQFLNSKEVTSNSLLYNFVNSESICFTLTSKCQPSCADDLLYPFDRYDHDIIFPNGDEDSSKFLEMCKEQLQVLVYVIQHLCDILSAKKILEGEQLIAEDIIAKVNISEEGNINIDEFVLILKDFEKAHLVAEKIYSETGIEPKISILEED